MSSRPLFTAPRLQLDLRTAIFSLVFVLLLGTVAVLATTAFFMARSSLRNLTNAHCLGVCRAVTRQVEHLLGSAPLTLEELASLTQNVRAPSISDSALREWRAASLG